MSIHPSMSILVDDDFETMTSIVRSLLRKLGLSHVDAVFDGKSALRELQKKQYDLVISDWNMASMSGYNLLKEVRAHPKLASIPFILITGVVHGRGGYGRKGCGRERLHYQAVHGGDASAKAERCVRSTARARRREQIALRRLSALPRIKARVRAASGAL
jgi:chemotaxis response regulator CheB